MSMSKSKRNKRKSVSQVTGARWVPGAQRMWTADNKRATNNKRSARGRTYRGE